VGGDEDKIGHMVVEFVDRMSFSLPPITFNSAELYKAILFKEVFSF
jgi:hypothetical protein